MAGFEIGGEARSSGLDYSSWMPGPSHPLDHIHGGQTRWQTPVYLYK